MRRRCLALLLSVCMMTVMVAGSVSAACVTPASSYNYGRESYTVWASPSASYLLENESNGVTRVEYINDTIVVEDYNDDFMLLSARTLPMELSFWGGFFDGATHNYLIFGQDNPDEDDTCEVVRVVKYTKNWERVGAASLYGANTSLPFRAGSLRCAEYDGMLYIRTAHQMYTANDGYRHQANLTIAVRESDMTVTDSKYGVSNSMFGYVSHSFNQFVLVDAQQNIVALDHGDAYPRSLVLMKYKDIKAGEEKFSGATTNSTVLEIAGETGDNVTGASVGGFAETTAGYVTAYNYDGVGGGGTKEIYLGFTAKDTLATTAVKISGTAEMGTPVLAPMGPDGGYIIWQQVDYYADKTQIHYAAYDANGNVGEVKTANGALSDCQPVVCDGKVVWYVTNESVPTFYTLDENGVTSCAAKYFGDVDTDAYYYDAVMWAVEKDVTTGTGATTFSPNSSCTRGQIVTFLWRAAGSPKASTTSTAFTDIKEGSYYYDAVIWAVENGITSGTTATTFSPNSTCTRGQIVTFLWRAKGEQKATISNPFKDTTDGAFYTDAMLWAVENNITTGTSATTFSPNNACTRGQCVTFLYRSF